MTREPCSLDEKEHLPTDTPSCPLSAKPPADGSSQFPLLTQKDPWINHSVTINIITPRHSQALHSKVAQQQEQENKELQGCHLQKAEVPKEVGVMGKRTQPIWDGKKNHKTLHWHLSLGTWCRKTQRCNLVNALPPRLRPYLSATAPTLSKVVGTVNLVQEPLKVTDSPRGKKMHHGGRRKRLK